MADKLIIKDGIITWNSGEVFNGSIVTQENIESIWEYLRKNLKRQGYPTQFAQMPDIRVVMVDSINFKRVTKVVNTPPTEELESARQQDRRKWIPKAFKLVFKGESENESYLIIMPKLDAEEYINNTTHQLLHVWEDILLLDPGTLAESFEANYQGI